MIRNPTTQNSLFDINGLPGLRQYPDNRPVDGFTSLTLLGLTKLTDQRINLAQHYSIPHQSGISVVVGYALSQPFNRRLEQIL